MKSDIEARLIRCFQTVFPDLDENSVRRANVDRVASWDSVATITLTATIEEEFGIQIDLEEIETLTSFERFLRQVEG